MYLGPRRFSLKRRISARTSWKRYVRHSLGMKAPRGYGWLTNPRRAAYNRISYRKNKAWKNAGSLLLLILLALGVIGNLLG